MSTGCADAMQIVSLKAALSDLASYNPLYKRNMNIVLIK